MKFIKAIILVLLFSNLLQISYAQKLNTVDFKLSFKVFQKQSSNMHGYKSEKYVGIIKVKSKNEYKGEYPFYYAAISKSLFMLGIKNIENNIIPPKVYYDDSIRTLSYKDSSGTEITKQFDVFTPTEEIVLNAMQMWLESKTD